MVKYYIANNWKKLVFIIIIAILLYILYSIDKKQNVFTSPTVCTDNSSYVVESPDTYFFEVMGQVVNP
jgi:hypothetical protein